MSIIGHILLESCLCIWAHATVSRVAIIARSSAVTSRSFTAKGRQRAFGTSKVVGPCPANSCGAAQKILALHVEDVDNVQELIRISLDEVQICDGPLMRTNL